jgi:hypothetical protein
VEIIFKRCWPVSEEASRSLSPGVSMEPGLTAFTRMGRCFKSVVQVREGTDGGFRGAINTIRGQPFAGDDGNIQDARGAIRQQRKRLLDREKEALYIDVEDEVVELFGDRAQRGTKERDRNKAKAYCRCTEEDSASPESALGENSATKSDQGLNGFIHVPRSLTKRA